MALPPPSVLFIAVLSIIDLLSAVVMSAGLAFFGTALGETGMASLLEGWAVTFFGFTALKLVALIGLLYARRWAVIVGAVVFKIPIPLDWLSSMTLATAFFVGATFSTWLARCRIGSA